ncbi:MAG: glucosylglycerol hydrolase, partial [Pseudomonadota bacterium]
ESREDLARFFEFLPALVEVTEYDLVEIAKLLNNVEPELAGPRYTPESLKAVARAWMDDMHEYCNVTNSLHALNPAQTDFMLNLRRFRRAHPWLRRNLRPEDHFDYMQPIDGRTVFTSLRHSPEGGQVFTIAHMEGGETSDFDPLRLPIPGIEGFGWHVALRSPHIGSDFVGGPIVLRDSMAIVYTRNL